MQFRGHSNLGIIIGVISYLVLTIIHKSYDHYLVILIAIFFALLPDIDIKSKASKMFYGLVLLSNIILIYVGYDMKVCYYATLLSIVPQLFKHRGFTHSILFLLLVPTPLLYFFIGNDGYNYYIVGAIAGISHISADKHYKLI